MTWVLFAIGLALFLFDVARLNMTGVAILGVVLMVAAALAAGALTRGFWFADDPDPDALSSLDVLERRDAACSTSVPSDVAAAPSPRGAVSHPGAPTPPQSGAPGIPGRAARWEL